MPCSRGERSSRNGEQSAPMISSVQWRLMLGSTIEKILPVLKDLARISWCYFGPFKIALDGTCRNRRPFLPKAGYEQNLLKLIARSADSSLLDQDQKDGVGARTRTVNAISEAYGCVTATE